MTADFDTESDSDDEITDASELIPEYYNLQMYRRCAKEQTPVVVGFKRSRQ